MQRPRPSLLLLATLLAPGALHAQGLQVAGRAAELSITAVSPHTLRVTLRPAGDAPGTVPVEDGRVLSGENWGEPLLRASSLPATRTLSHGDLRVSVSPSPLTVDVRTSEGEVVQHLVFDEADGSVAFRLGDGPVLGLGSGGETFDRKGSYYSMQPGHRAGEYLVYGARIPVPFLVGTDGWSLFFHRPYNGELDLRQEPGRFLPTERGGYFPQRGELVASRGEAAQKEAPLPLDVFVTRVDTPSRALSEYAEVTGRPAMPPKWALGYMQSHRNLSVGGADEVMEVARTFREKRLPVDALIYLGTGFTAGGWNTGHGEFAFHPDVFPRPQEMLDSLDAMDYNVVLHLTEPPRELHGSIPPGPGERTGPSHAADYWQEHEEVFSMGVAGWWPDMGDPLDADAKLARHYTYRAGPLASRPGERPWSLHRAGFAGMQKFGGWTWSGDVASSWETLAGHVPVGINASLSTSPFWGTDILGFYPSEDTSGELYVRWFQFGAFNPSFRAHGVAWRTRLPWGWNPGEMGPIQMQEYLRTGSLAADTAGGLQYRETELHDPEVEPIIKRYLELRYQLMPYTYTLAREAHDTGMPFMRALWLHFPDDPRAVRRTHEFLWGPDLLVAPVVEPGVQGPVHYFAMREIYLPEGQWYDFWRNNPPIPGNQTIRRTVDLETLPLYVRAGAILPMDPVRQHVDEPVDEPMTLRVYPGADGEFSLYDDDGRSMDFAEGEASWTRMSWDDGARTLTIEPGEGPPVSRQFRVVLVGEDGERTVDYAGSRVRVRFD